MTLLEQVPDLDVRKYKKDWGSNKENERDFQDWLYTHVTEYKFQNIIRTQYLDHFTPVRAYDLGIALRRDYFLPWDTINLILKHIVDNLLYNQPLGFDQLELSESTFHNQWFVTGEGTGVLIAANKQEELDVQKLTHVLKTVNSDNHLMRKFERLKKENEIEQLTKEFSKKVESLVTDIEGGELIKGYCKLGY